MMEGIQLVRVDFRLIHGQVITKWSKLTDAKSIIVVNDQLAADEFMADIYVMAAPPGMKVDVISKDQFVKDAEDGKFDSGKILVLFKNIEDAREVVEKGVKFKLLQVGGLGSGNGRTSVVKGISVDKTDIANLAFVQDQGAEVTFQVTPEEPKLSLEKASKKVR
ncbi:PTS sugar transporter subunit IIB [Enterococcus hulanensis]|uniref:PTS sugar transporter subunit IIB n=1 Tax=Enterococcus hulanensis TaxID=2559929 RepID=UPI00289053D0|nr:PTS sugar transporter subunit IIB [Enterococcus hulanensis]MDT2659653.1 PTS sugar transporter subunit IIB [Enterococcus hulanensis]